MNKINSEVDLIDVIHESCLPKCQKNGPDALNEGILKALFLNLQEGRCAISGNRINTSSLWSSLDRTQDRVSTKREPIRPNERQKKVCSVQLRQLLGSGNGHGLPLDVLNAFEKLHCPAKSKMRLHVSSTLSPSSSTLPYSSSSSSSFSSSPSPSSISNPTSRMLPH